MLFCSFASSTMVCTMYLIHVINPLTKNTRDTVNKNSNKFMLTPCSGSQDPLELEPKGQ